MVIAMIVAPILGVMSYFVVSFFVGEKPHAAEEGQSYQLVEKPNCRYSSGNCGLKNGDFELKLSTEPIGDDRVLLKLESVFPLDGVKVALVEYETDEKRPMDMRRADGDGLAWTLDVARPEPERDRLHLVAASNGALYYGDVAMKFTLHEAASN
jgi:hypothetical protein